MWQGLEFGEQSKGLAKITIVQKLLLSIFISCSLYFVYLVNCVLALKFVRFSTLLIKISITISIWLDYQPLFGKWARAPPPGEDHEKKNESFEHVKVNVSKINRLSTMKSFILTWSGLLFCLGLVQKVAAQISQLCVWTLLLTYVKREWCLRALFMRCIDQLASVPERLINANPGLKILFHFCCSRHWKNFETLWLWCFRCFKARFRNCQWRFLVFPVADECVFVVSQVKMFQG